MSNRIFSNIFNKYTVFLMKTFIQEKLIKAEISNSVYLKTGQKLLSESNFSSESLDIKFMILCHFVSQISRN